MKRRAPMPPRTQRMPRTSVLAPRKPVPAKNGKRRAKAFARAYGSKDRVECIKWHGCLVCARVPSENAHVTTGGMGRKADAASIVPLCRDHHRDLHQLGLRSFEQIHAPMLCGRTLASWAETYADAWTKWEQGA